MSNFPKVEERFAVVASRAGEGLVLQGASFASFEEAREAAKASDAIAVEHGFTVQLDRRPGLSGEADVIRVVRASILLCPKTGRKIEARKSEKWVRFVAPDGFNGDVCGWCGALNSQDGWHCTRCGGS